MRHAPGKQVTAFGWPGLPQPAGSGAPATFGAAPASCDLPAPLRPVFIRYDSSQLPVICQALFWCDILSLAGDAWHASQPGAKPGAGALLRHVCLIECPFSILAREGSAMKPNRLCFTLVVVTLVLATNISAREPYEVTIETSANPCDLEPFTGYHLYLSE